MFETMKTTARIALIVVVVFLPAFAPAADNKPFNLSVTTHLGDTRQFLEGDLVSFYVSLDANAYLTILYQDSGGSVNLLLPNELHADNFFQAGLFIPIPNEQNPFQFRITAPFGRETLWVWASDRPLPGLENQSHLSNAIDAARNSFESLCHLHKARCETASLSIDTSATTPNP